jgi:hypothetical protein
MIDDLTYLAIYLWPSRRFMMPALGVMLPIVTTLTQHLRIVQACAGTAMDMMQRQFARRGTALASITGTFHSALPRRFAEALPSQMLPLHLRARIRTRFADGQLHCKRGVKGMWPSGYVPRKTVKSKP